MDEKRTKRALFRGIARWALLALVVFAGWSRILPHEGDSVERMREGVLRSDLQQMRKAIDNFTLEKKRAPKLLQELVDGKYLRSIPIDPLTRQQDWRLSWDSTPNVPGAGVTDVHSASKGDAFDGSQYRTW
jgi:general secretion pathway protein G